jgi:hypothetical protein
MIEERILIFDELMASKGGLVLECRSSISKRCGIGAWIYL